MTSDDGKTREEEEEVQKWNTDLAERGEYTDRREQGMIGIIRIEQGKIRRRWIK